MWLKLYIESTMNTIDYAIVVLFCVAYTYHNMLLLINSDKGLVKLIV